ncbi:hypothetical protein ACLKA6_003384 [Drosophila palustris]
MDSSITSLLTLNDDCLDNIFQYFSLHELLAMFGNIHSLIDDAIERQLHRFRHFEFSMRSPPQYNGDQLQALGRHLQSLNVNVGYSIRANEVLILLHQLFLGARESERLRALKIQHANITSDYVKEMLTVVPLLRELNLSRCDIEDHNQLMLLLHSAKKLETLALYNKDAANLDKTILSRLRYFKINWLVGTTMFNVGEVSELHPHLSIAVYQSSNVDVYGPPVARKTKYFHQ